MNINNLGSGRVRGSINTQWQTNLAIERVLIGLKGGVSGITELLSTIEFIGAILLIFWSAFIIVFILLIELILLFVSIYKSIRGMNTEEVPVSGITDKEHAEYTKYDLTDEEMKEFENHS